MTEEVSVEETEEEEVESLIKTLGNVVIDDNFDTLRLNLYMDRLKQISQPGNLPYLINSKGNQLIHKAYQTYFNND